MLRIEDGLLLTAIAIVGSVAQLCLKRGADKGDRKNLWRALLQVWIMAGIFLMGINVLAFVWILRRVSLTAAMPVAALVYILVPCGAFLFFGEKARPGFWFGALLILTGIILTSV